MNRQRWSYLIQAIIAFGLIALAFFYPAKLILDRIEVHRSYYRITIGCELSRLMDQYDEVEHKDFRACPQIVDRSVANQPRLMPIVKGQEYYRLQLSVSIVHLGVTDGRIVDKHLQYFQP